MPSNHPGPDIVLVVVCIVGDQGVAAVALHGERILYELGVPGYEVLNTLADIRIDGLQEAFAG